MPLTSVLIGWVLSAAAIQPSHPDPRCSIDVGADSPPGFTVHLPKGYRFTAERGTDTALWQISKPGGLDIHYEGCEAHRRAARTLAKPRDSEPITTQAEPAAASSG